jgi:flagellar motor switch protein FliG
VKELSKVIEEKLDTLSLPKTSSKIGSPQLAEIRAELKNMNKDDPTE